MHTATSLTPDRSISVGKNISCYSDACTTIIEATVEVDQIAGVVACDCKLVSGTESDSWLAYFRIKILLASFLQQRLELSRQLHRNIFVAEVSPTGLAVTKGITRNLRRMIGEHLLGSCSNLPCLLQIVSYAMPLMVELHT